MQLNERIISPRSGPQRLHGILRAPPGGDAARLVVMCDPFAEEKKCAHRPLVDAARALCAAGFSVLRFDYRGCGDSEGDFADVAPADWREDIAAALDFGRSETRAEWVGIMGLRLGANLAAVAARADRPLDGLILWEPILDGKQYVRHNLRRSMIKAMLTEGEQFDAQSAARKHDANIIDFDGYLVSAQTREQLEALDTGAGAFAGPTLVLNIGPKDEPGEPYRTLAAAFGQATALGVRLEPFWNRIGLVDAGPVIETTLDWLRTAARVPAQA